MQTNLNQAIALMVAGVGVAAAGIYVGETDDAPGAAMLGLLVAAGLVWLGVRATRRRA